MQKVNGVAQRGAKILPPTPENLALVAEAVRRDEVVGMPTETVYGLAGNAFSPTALARIFEAKERPTFDPLIIHVSPPKSGLQNFGIKDLEKLRLIDCKAISPLQQERIERLIQEFWPGPLTLVLPKHPDVPDLATSGLPTVALRMPAHPIAQALITAAQTPLAAPSANRFGRISPTHAKAVYEELGDRISWILEGGDCQIGVESTILSFPANGEVLVLRPGGAPVEKIEQILYVNLVRQLSFTPASQQVLSPGMLESHYAPARPFRLLPKPVSELHSKDLEGIYEGLDPISPHSQVGLLMISGDPQSLGPLLEGLLKRPIIAKTLSKTGDLQEAAKNLFSSMRELDSEDLALILAEPCRRLDGLGYAIMDRMKRASARKPPSAF
jgi:L-threonylcarbamoyladenylate synthase